MLEMPVASVGLVAAVLLTLAPAAGSAAQAGSLDFQAKFTLVSDPALCPADVPAATDCRARITSGVVRGLGAVSVTYDWPLGLGPPTCPADSAKLLATNGQIVVAGKGEITFTIAEGAQCVWFPSGPGPSQVCCPEPRNEPQELTITGGTGPFAAASGRLTLDQRWFNWARVPDVGGETWTGTLEVPGLTFDVTPPTLSGANAKTVRMRSKGARSARVSFKVTATDDVDGGVPVLCQPQSGSRFEAGRTSVLCEATDSSGNTGTAAFTVNVKRRR